MTSAPLPVYGLTAACSLVAHECDGLDNRCPCSCHEHDAVEHIDRCAVRVSRGDGGWHVCRLEAGHDDEHACTCPHTWAARLTPIPGP